MYKKSRPVRAGSMGRKSQKGASITTGKSVVGSVGRLNKRTTAKQERSKITSC